MDLDLNEEQEMLRGMVRGVCSSYANLETVRELEDDPVGYPAELWKQMAELDLIGLMLPSEYGGSEMSVLEGAVVYMELGRSLSPSPHFVSAVMSAGVLLRAGSAEQKQSWLPRIASGDAIVTTAWLEPGNGFGARGVQTEATADGDGFVLDGVKWHVPFAKAATAFVVLARTGDGANDVDLFLVDATTAGITMDQQLTLASDTQYAVTLSGVRVPASARIGGAQSGWATWHDTMLDGVIMLAAQAVGGARYVLDITVQYAKDREQFDKPLGAFQAISHYLADAVTAVDGAEMLVYEAAWARANGQPVDRLAPMAKLFACKTFRDVTAMSQQVFGGVGFTVEYDIQLYFRRAKTLQISWWDDRFCEELVASDVFAGIAEATMAGRLAHTEDADAMTETIATVFFNDPLWSWAFADDSVRAQQFRVWWRVFVDAGFRNEWTWVTPDCESVAIWTRPNGVELLPAEEERLVELVVEFIPGERANVVLQVLAQFEAAHPHDTPHYYLGIVATHDDHRGHGYAEQLLAENLKQIDAEHMPAYLESSNPLNLNRYMRLGFEPTGEIEIPDGRPAVTTMWRPER